MIRYFILLAALLTGMTVRAQGLPTDGPLTVRPILQQLGERLLKGKTGSIVAINPENGEIICLATNTPKGADVRQAIGKPMAPGSTFKTAQALTLLSEGIVTPDTRMECNNGITDGNIKVGCHKHRSPLNLTDALAQSCNTWFIVNFGSSMSRRTRPSPPGAAICSRWGLAGRCISTSLGSRADCWQVPTI